ncbi:MAG: adenylate/guanylate cyclase domain-containing protein [Planctomycetota bacterium]
MHTIARYSIRRGGHQARYLIWRGTLGVSPALGGEQKIRVASRALRTDLPGMEQGVMADLIAQGPQNYHRWRREVPDAASCIEVSIGRTGADWNVPWDTMISRKHVKLVPKANQRVEITVVGDARNPVFHQGRHAIRFVLVPGDHFVIGKTTFTLSSGNQNQAGVEEAGDADVTENVFDHVALRRRHFHDVQSRIDVLTRLPDLIASSESDQELLVRVTSVLLQSTPAAGAVSILDASRLGNDAEAEIDVLHYDNRSALLQSSPVSRRLVRRALETRESILNVWGSLATGGAQFTAREEVDWAFCVPLRTQACRGWMIYITGQMHDPEQDSGGGKGSASEQLHDDVKFAELVGTTVASLRQSRTLQRREAAMRNFFSPLVMQAITGNEIENVLKPREADLAVMFCDLRGFSDHSERHSANLLQLLSDVSDALGVMTKHILGYDGVIGDFHGDAAMGFWGWPLEQTHEVVSAVSAALAIRNEYRHGELGFRCGIGIAFGRAVAGQIGTTDQVKVTSFGPVVNLASRLESMTKRFGAEIILDETAARALQESAGAIANAPKFHLRRLGKVRPAGFNTPIVIHQLLAENERDAEIEEAYESALVKFETNRAEEAVDQLRTIPAQDGPTEFLRKRHAASAIDDAGIIDVPK